MQNTITISKRDDYYFIYHYYKYLQNNNEIYSGRWYATRIEDVHMDTNCFTYVFDDYELDNVRVTATFKIYFARKPADKINIF
jgi:hypothetical protein